MSEMKTVRAETSRSAKASTDDDVVDNNDIENATNKERLLNDTVYPQIHTYRR